jgi:hypothetical protein
VVPKNGIKNGSISISLASDLINICPRLAFIVLSGVLLPETTLQPVSHLAGVLANKSSKIK